MTSSDEKPQPLLDWLCNSGNYAACHAIDAMTAGLGSLFRLVQGGSQFTPELSEKLESIDSSSDLPAIIGPVNAFIMSLERLVSVDAVNDLVDEIANKTVTHSAAMLQREVAYKNIDQPGATSALQNINVSCLTLPTCFQVLLPPCSLCQFLHNLGIVGYWWQRAEAVDQG